MVRAILRKVAFLLAAGIVSLVATGAATAQIPRCGPREDMVSILKETFTESQQAVGLLNPILLVELFVSEKGGFTIIVTGADGVSCVLVAGIGWEPVPRAAGDGV